MSAFLIFFVETGRVTNIVVEPYERKQIKITTKRKLKFFIYSINGYGFEFLRSYDFTYDGYTGYVILKNIGSIDTSNTPIRTTTEITWYALTVE